jgi:hypothetical protein
MERMQQRLCPGSVDKDAQFLQVFPGPTINRAKFLGLLMGLECHLDLD